MTKVKTRMLRRAIEISESINFSNLKIKDLDGLVDFVVELYGNKFSREDFYDGAINAEIVEKYKQAEKCKNELVEFKGFVSLLYRTKDSLIIKYEK